MEIANEKSRRWRTHPPEWPGKIQIAMTATYPHHDQRSRAVPVLYARENALDSQSAVPHRELVRVSKSACAGWSNFGVCRWKGSCRRSHARVSSPAGAIHWVHQVVFA